MKRLRLRRSPAPDTVPAPLTITKTPVNETIGNKIGNKTPPVQANKQGASPLLSLNHKQALFLRHYLACNNATEAAKKAGYSRGTAYSQGARLLTHGVIAAEISKRRAAVLEKLDFNVDRALSELGSQATSNMQDYFTVGPNGQPLLDWSRLTREQAGALQELTVEEFVDGRSDKRKVRRVKFKLADKQGAIELWGKFKGVFVEKHQHDHRVTLVGALLDEIDAANRGPRMIEAVVNRESGG